MVIFLIVRSFILIACWSKNVNERPSIQQIVNILQGLGGNDGIDFNAQPGPGSEVINIPRRTPLTPSTKNTIYQYFCLT